MPWLLRRADQERGLPGGGDTDGSCTMGVGTQVQQEGDQAWAKALRRNEPGALGWREVMETEQAGRKDGASSGPLVPRLESGLHPNSVTSVLDYWRLGTA